MIDVLFFAGKLMAFWTIGYIAGVMVLSVKKVFEASGQ